VPRLHNGVRMGLRGVDESLLPIIALRLLGEVLGELQGPTAIYTDGSKTEGLVGIGIFLCSQGHWAPATYCITGA
jgi:hypothetical protein